MGLNICQGQATYPGGTRVTRQMRAVSGRRRLGTPGVSQGPATAGPVRCHVEVTNVQAYVTPTGLWAAASDAVNPGCAVQCHTRLTGHATTKGRACSGRCRISGIRRWYLARGGRGGREWKRQGRVEGTLPSIGRSCTGYRPDPPSQCRRGTDDLMQCHAYGCKWVNYEMQSQHLIKSKRGRTA